MLSKFNKVPIMDIKLCFASRLLLLASVPVLAQAPNDIVAVQASAAMSGRPFGNCSGFDRLIQPPTVVPFQIPSGKVFVVTSVDWQTSVPARPERTVIAEIIPVVKGLTNGPIATGAGRADSEGTAGGSILTPNGFVVKGNYQLCIAIRTPSGLAPAEGIAHGYFSSN